MGASPSVPPRRGRGRGTRAPGQSSLNFVEHTACPDEWVTPNHPRTTNPRGRPARQRGQPSVPRMALREVEWDHKPSGPTGPSTGATFGTMLGSPRGWLGKLEIEMCLGWVKGKSSTIWVRKFSVVIVYGEWLWNRTNVLLELSRRGKLICFLNSSISFLWC